MRDVAPTSGVLVQLGQQMDEHLSGLAHAHLGTRFLRVPLPRGSRLPRVLGLKHSPGDLFSPMQMAQRTHLLFSLIYVACHTVGLVDMHTSRCHQALTCGLAAESCMHVYHEAVSGSRSGFLTVFCPPAALVCFRGGAVTAWASVYALCGGMDLREEDVTKWLRRIGALRAPGQAAAASGAAAAEQDSSEVAMSSPFLLCAWHVMSA